jgi:hypothetical protein
MADDDLRRLLDEMRQENAAAHEETRRRFDATAERIGADTRHQFELTAEAIKHEVRLTADGVIQVTQELRRETADIREDMHRGFADTQAMIKFSHAELDRRVSALEEAQRSLEESVADLQARVQRIETGAH